MEKHSVRLHCAGTGARRPYLLRSYRLRYVPYSFDTYDRQILYTFHTAVDNLLQYLPKLERLTRIESTLERHVCSLLVSAQQGMTYAVYIKIIVCSLSKHPIEHSVHVSFSFYKLYFQRAQVSKISTVVVGFREFVPSFYCELIKIYNTWCFQVLRSPKEAFAAAMQSWRERCEKCVCLQGDYVEK